MWFKVFICALVFSLGVEVRVGAFGLLGKGVTVDFKGFRFWVQDLPLWGFRGFGLWVQGPDVRGSRYRVSGFSLWRLSGLGLSV